MQLGDAWPPEGSPGETNQPLGCRFPVPVSRIGRLQLRWENLGWFRCGLCAKFQGQRPPGWVSGNGADCSSLGWAFTVHRRPMPGGQPFQSSYSGEHPDAQWSLRATVLLVGKVGCSVSLHCLEKLVCPGKQALGQPLPTSATYCLEAVSVRANFV